MKHVSPRNLSLAITLVLAVPSLVSCNTVRGAGRDVSATGDAVAGAATQVEAELARSKAERDANERRERESAAQKSRGGY